MQIEVYSDTVCPWCYVGIQRLKRALAQRAELPLQLNWLPFELNPTIAAEGEDRATYMQRRFGDITRFTAAQQRLRDIGVELGIEFRFDLQQRIPNTRRSHALIAWAREQGGDAQTRVKTAVLAAYFSRGLDIGNVDVLTDLAASCELDAPAARRAIEDPTAHAAVAALEDQARRWNISGVPTFIFNRRLAFSGAQEEALILEYIDRARVPA